MLSAATLLFSAVGLVVRAQPVSSIPRLVLAVGATFIPLVAVVGLVLALLCRRIALAVIGAFLVTATAAIQVNWYYGGQRAEIGPFTEIRLFSANLRIGQVDEHDLIRIAEQSADVITVMELTPDSVKRLERAGLDKTFPHSWLVPMEGAGGIGLWSRYPMRRVNVTRHRGVTMPAGWLEVPGAELNPLVASIHVMSPVAGDANTVDDWSRSMAGAKAQLNTFASAAGQAAIIIGGDYNSTPDMRQFRDLLTNGYRDAVEQTGSGFAPTFRADTLAPPVITIDHVLTRNAAVSSIHTITVKGSDHRALLARIRVPLAPTS